MAADLLSLAGSRPRAALARARELLARHPDADTAAVARQAAGVALRELGDTDAAAAELRVALRLARATGSPDRQADVLTSYGTVLIKAGRTRQGLAALDAAVRSAHGPLLGQVLMRRGGVLQILGRYPEAHADLRRALGMLRHDPIWAPRTRSGLGQVYLGLGATERADAEFAAAETQFARNGQRLETAFIKHNRAMTAFASGDLPGALRHLDDAAARYAELGVPVPDAAIDRACVLLASGLPGDALAEIEAAARRPCEAVKRAELQLAAARAALAAGRCEQAAERAVTSRIMFAEQGREWWRLHATLVLLRASFGIGGRLDLAEAEQTAIRLGSLHSDETADAWLLAGRIALAAGRRDDADRLLASAARAARRRLPAFARAAGWLAEALRAQAAGDRRRLLTACGRGFALLEQHMATLAATELRAQATAHGAELADLALRAALNSGKPRLLFEWNERWRAVALAVPPLRPAADPALRSQLAALRDVTNRLDRARADGRPASGLQRERLDLEVAIRARCLRTALPHAPRTAPRTAQHPPLTQAQLVAREPGHVTGSGFAELDAAIGDGRLVELIAVDGDLHVLVIGGGRVRRYPAGSLGDAASEVDYARFGLDRIARGRLPEPAAEALAAMDAIGHRLDAVLLGRARDHLGDGPVVVVPPGRLHAVPWAMLPTLRDRPVSVAPSARAWLRTGTSRSFCPEAVVLVSGPGLAAASAEVRTLAAEYAGATVLADGTATTAAVLAALDGAELAHIAAHGVFRAQSPLFSSLLMDDGPMTVHDVEGLRRAPYRLILPSCESGLGAPAGADELLGLASALLPLGTAGIVASVAQVNDVAAAPLMLALHRRLRASPAGSLAAAMVGARHDALGATGGDPVVTAAGWSFIVLGA